MSQTVTPDLQGTIVPRERATRPIAEGTSIGHVHMRAADLAKIRNTLLCSHLLARLGSMPRSLSSVAIWLLPGTRIRRGTRGLLNTRPSVPIFGHGPKYS